MSSESQKTSRTTLPNIFEGWSAPAALRDSDGLPKPDEAHFYLGADPAWGPHKEAWTDTQRPLNCPRCGREGAIRKGEAEICGVCGRYGFDHRVEAARRREEHRTSQATNQPAKFRPHARDTA